MQTDRKLVRPKHTNEMSSAETKEVWEIGHAKCVPEPGTIAELKVEAPPVSKERRTEELDKCYEQQNLARPVSEVDVILDLCGNEKMRWPEDATRELLPVLLEDTARVEDAPNKTVGKWVTINNRYFEHKEHAKHVLGVYHRSTRTSDRPKKQFKQKRAKSADVWHRFGWKNPVYGRHSHELRGKLYYWRKKNGCYLSSIFEGASACFTPDKVVEFTYPCCNDWNTHEKVTCPIEFLSLIHI